MRLHAEESGVDDVLRFKSAVDAPYRREGRLVINDGNAGEVLENFKRYYDELKERVELEAVGDEAGKKWLKDTYGDEAL